MLGLADPAGAIMPGELLLLRVGVAVYLSAWLVAWPPGNAAAGPLRSSATMAGSFRRVVGYPALRMAGVIFVATRRAARRTGVALAGAAR